MLVLDIHRKLTIVPWHQSSSRKFTEYFYKIVHDLLWEYTLFYGLLICILSKKYWFRLIFGIGFTTTAHFSKQSLKSSFVQIQAVFAMCQWTAMGTTSDNGSALTPFVGQSFCKNNLSSERHFIFAKVDSSASKAYIKLSVDFFHSFGWKLIYDPMAAE